MSQEAIAADLAKYADEAAICETHGHALENGVCVDCGEEPCVVCKETPCTCWDHLEQ